jgi:hypothetical protein
MDYRCNVCQKKFPGDMMVFREHIEVHIVDLVKKDFPQWVEKDGLCRKCVDYYHHQLKGDSKETVEHTPCMTRSWWRRFTQKFSKQK